MVFVKQLLKCDMQITRNQSTTENYLLNFRK